jgi:alpha-tubulin suppressor-like RCC1 family protein
LLVGCGSSGGGGGGSSSPKSSSNDMNNFSFTNTNKIIKPAVIKGQNVDITIEHVYSNPTPIVTHNGTKYSPEGYIDLTKATMPLHYNITAANGDVKRYYVTIRRAFIVSDEGGLRTAIDTIQSDIPSNKYVTILITKDLDLSVNERNITSAWANNNITLEKYNSIQDVTIKGLTIAGENIVTLDGVNVDKTLVIKGFTFDKLSVIKPAVINGTHIDIIVDYNATYAPPYDLRPTVEHTGIDYSPKEAIDFANLPANYTVTGDSSTKSYSVIVRRGFVVSTAKELASAIDTINNDINSNNYTTILINNDINLTGTNQRNISSTWAGNNITIENNSNVNILTVNGLTFTDNNTVGLVNIKRSSEKNLTNFSFADGVIKNATINGQNVDITINYNASNPTPIVTHTGLDYSPKEAINFTTTTIPKTYKITAGDGTTKDYNATIRRGFVVSTATELADAIDTINNDIDNSNYITILINNNINLRGATNRTIPSSWKGKNIILENNSTASNVTIKWLAIEGNDTVGLKGVKLERVIAAVAAGGWHSLTLDSEGKLWATGLNEQGQLGLGNNTYRIYSFQPVTINGLPSNATIISIVAGSYYSFALDSNGNLWATGYNGYGGLGLGDNKAQNSFQPVTISNLTSNAKIISIAAGWDHSIALDSNGNLWATGRNYDGQLGLSNKYDQNSFKPVTISGLASSARIVSIAVSQWHSLALDSRGKQWATGGNGEGELGLGNIISQTSFKPVQSGSIANATIVSIVASNSYSLALDSDGKLWATGYNEWGQLGLGNNNRQISFQPVTIPNLPSNATIVSIAAGHWYSFVIDSNGKLWSSGDNHYGQLGLSDTANRNLFQPVTIPNSNATIISNALGREHSLALTSDGELRATGYNLDGQLGLVDNYDRNEFMPVPNPWLK